MLLVNIDGASRGNPGPASVGVFIQDESGAPVAEHGRAIGATTNNAAEYQALVDALRLGRKLGATVLKIRSDSELLVRQFNGVYRVKNDRLLGFLKEAQLLRREFESVELLHVRREENREADRLANEALDSPDGGAPDPAAAPPPRAAGLRRAGHPPRRPAS